MKIEIYDPAMCCTSGVCGTSIDEKLVKINENIELMEAKYMELQVYRYMISQQPLKFKENNDVYNLIKQNGGEALPITTINGRVIKYGEYPSLEEIQKAIDEDKGDRF